MSVEATARTIGIVAVILIAVLLGACAQIEQARLYAGKGAAKAVMAECALSAGQRRANLDAVNKSLEAQNFSARATALDCDGDGAPDPI